MLLLSLILVPLFGTLMILIFYTDTDYKTNENSLKISALIVTVIELFISLILWFSFDNSCKYFQFVQEHYTIGHYDFYLGLDGLSIYLVFLTTLIAPIPIISNWKSINGKSVYYLVIILLLESALLCIYSALDSLTFYIFFESILAPLFTLIGFFGSTGKLRASFYFFLYTFLGSLSNPVIAIHKNMYMCSGNHTLAIHKKKNILAWIFRISEVMFFFTIFSTFILYVLWQIEELEGKCPHLDIDFIKQFALTLPSLALGFSSGLGVIYYNNFLRKKNKENYNMDIYFYCLHNPNIWPLYIISALFILTLSVVLVLYGFTWALMLMYASLISVVYFIWLWFKHAVLYEKFSDNIGLPIVTQVEIGKRYVISLILLFPIAGCIIIYELFNNTFLLKEGNFISRVYYYSLSEGCVEKSIEVFCMVFYFIFRLEIFLNDYYVYMNPGGFSFGDSNNLPWNNNNHGGGNGSGGSSTLYGSANQEEEEDRSRDRTKMRLQDMLSPVTGSSIPKVSTSPVSNISLSTTLPNPYPFSFSSQVAPIPRSYPPINLIPRSFAPIPSSFPPVNPIPRSFAPIPSSFPPVNPIPRSFAPIPSIFSPIIITTQFVHRDHSSGICCLTLADYRDTSLPNSQVILQEFSKPPMHECKIDRLDFPGQRGIRKDNRSVYVLFLNESCFHHSVGSVSGVCIPDMPTVIFEKYCPIPVSKDGANYLFFPTSKPPLKRGLIKKD